MKILDKYFGEHEIINYSDKRISQYAEKFFGHDVIIEYTNNSCKSKFYKDNIYGFFNKDGFRIPFEYEPENSKYHNKLKININFDVVYTRNHDFSDYNYHILSLGGILVDKDLVDEYYKKIVSILPESIKDSFVFTINDLYFYPNIDSRNGKRVNIVIDVILYGFISNFIHYQERDLKKFYAACKFSYNGIFLLFENSIKFTSVLVNDKDKVWGDFAAELSKEKRISEIMSEKYKTFNEFITDYNKSLEVINMLEI